MNLDELIADTSRQSQLQPCKHPRFTGIVREYLDRVDAEVDDPLVHKIISNIRKLGGSWSDTKARAHYHGECECE
jgi:hypothetical protein